MPTQPTAPRRPPAAPRWRWPWTGPPEPAADGSKLAQARLMRRPLRSRLLLLVLVVLLPAAGAGVWMIVQAARAQRAALEANLRNTARALSMVVEGQLSERATVARVLSLSRVLDTAPDIPGEMLSRFAGQARRAMEGMAGAVELSSSSEVLVDTGLPMGASPRPRPVGSAPLISTPAIEPLAPGPGGVLRATVVQPLLRDGQAVLNLAVSILPTELQSIIDRQQLPSGWVGTVFDARGSVVARHPGGMAYAGRLATADLKNLMASRDEGVFDSVSLDGDPMLGYFSRSRQGWTYFAAMPRPGLTDHLPAALAQSIIGALLLLALPAAGALWLARRSARPLDALKDAAARMQADQPPGQRWGDASVAMRPARSDLERQVSDAVALTRAAEQRASHTQRVEALGRLTGAVAHDFNNLLGVISNSAHLIERRAVVPELQAPLAAILRAVDVGSRLTQHLLRFAGRHPAQPQPLNLAATLNDMQDLLKIVLGKRIDLSLAVARDTRRVTVDPNELELALINLALNARDALPGGGHVWLAARNAEPGDMADPGPVPGPRVLVSVTDDGVGIDTGLADRVFEPFFTTKAAGQGTGLGLSQVHGFCVQAGGSAWLASTPGLGTTVTMALPAHDASGADAAAPLAAPPRPSVAGVRVLLVEDNDDLADVTAVLLASYGCVVERAANPEQALQLLAGAQQFDAVLSDVTMPGGIDGVDFARMLREQRPSLPVVLISGYSDKLAPAIAQDFTVLRKPCAPLELVAALQHAVQRAGAG